MVILVYIIPVKLSSYVLSGNTLTFWFGPQVRGRKWGSDTAWH